MNITQNLISADKYPIKCPYTMTPKGICIHNTANDAPATNEINYMKNNNNEVSFHIAVDDIQAIQAIPFNRNAWHAGDGGNGEGNRNYIAMEICYSSIGGDKFDKAEANAAKVVAKILKDFGWTIANVKKHQDFSGKLCPHRTLEKGWQRFLDMIQAELNPAPAPTKALFRVRKTWADAKSQKGAFSKLANAKAECDKHEGYSVFNERGDVVYTKEPPKPTGTSYAEKGTFYFNTSVRIRTAPSLSAHDTGLTYDNGESVIYHTVHLNKDGYNWIQYNRANGTQGFCAIRNLATGEKFGYAV